MSKEHEGGFSGPRYYYRNSYSNYIVRWRPRTIPTFFYPLPLEFVATTSDDKAKIYGWFNDKSIKGLNVEGYLDVEHKVDKPKTIKRALFLGDSFLDIPHTDVPIETLPDFLRKALPAYWEVINIACGGWGTDQELLALVNDGIKYKPDYTILFFTPGNDLSNNLSHCALGKRKPKPYFEFSFGRLNLVSLQGGPQKISLVNRLRAKLYRYLMRFQIAKRVHLLQLRMQSLYFKGDDDFSLSHINAFIEPMSTRMQYGWKLTFAIIDEMHRICKKAGSKFAVFYNPHCVYYEGSGWLAGGGLLKRAP